MKRIMYEKIVLSNGVRVVAERIGYVRSAALGFGLEMEVDLNQQNIMGFPILLSI